MAHQTYPVFDTTVLWGFKVTPFWKPLAQFSDIDRRSYTADLTGVVTVAGLPQEYSKVFIYSRETGILIKQLKTNASGTYLIDYLDALDTENYFAVAITDHPNGYNAQIWDKLTPG